MVFNHDNRVDTKTGYLEAHSEVKQCLLKAVLKGSVFSRTVTVVIIIITVVIIVCRQSICLYRIDWLGLTT